MKKFVLLLLLVSAAFVLSARTIYITRHGHRGDKRYFDKAVREQKLTPLGVEQANLLAHYLKEKCNFNGTILVSPLLRTLETALPTAKLLNKKMILEPGLQELSTAKKRPRAMTFAEIEERFPGMVVKGPAFVEPWRVFDEDTTARRKRTADALDRILAANKGDLLLVGHGATVGDLRRYLDPRLPEGKKVDGMAWNCCLFIYELDENDQPVSCRYTTEFIPDEKVTNNFRCPKIERPNDPQYMTKQQEKEAAARRKAAKEGKNK